MHLVKQHSQSLMRQALQRLRLDLSQVGRTLRRVPGVGYGQRGGGNSLAGYRIRPRHNGSGSDRRCRPLSSPVAADRGERVRPGPWRRHRARGRSIFPVESPSSFSRRECRAGVRPPPESGLSLRTGLSLLQLACAGAPVGRRVPLAGGRLCGAPLCARSAGQVAAVVAAW